MKKTSSSVQLLYGTIPGRILLKGIMSLRLDRVAARFLWSPWSRPMIGPYCRKHGLDLSQEEKNAYGSFRDFFARTRDHAPIDITPHHLISPCDGWLSLVPIDTDSRFAIKGSLYRLKDLLQDEDLARNYHNGICLIFRLAASDYHHYCYIDDGFQGNHHHIPGILHSVQPIACETFPVYTLNRRCWSLLTTEQFGPVVQCEVGSLIVGGIFNERENTRFCKGMEKGHFELAGSTIVLLFEPGTISLRPELMDKLSQDDEIRVTLGEWIGISERSCCPYEP